MTLYGLDGEGDSDAGPGRGRPAPEGGRRTGSYKLRMNDLERQKLETIRKRWEKRLSPNGLDTSDVLRFALEIADAIDTDRQPEIPLGLLSRVLMHEPSVAPYNPEAFHPPKPAIDPTPPPPRAVRNKPVKPAKVAPTEPTVTPRARALPAATMPDEEAEPQEAQTRTHLTEQQCAALAVRIRTVLDAIHKYTAASDKYLALKVGSQARTNAFPGVRLARHVLADAITSANRFRATMIPQHEPLPDIADIFEGEALPLPHSQLMPTLRQWATVHCKPYLRGVLAGLIV